MKKILLALSLCSAGTLASQSPRGAAVTTWVPPYQLQQSRTSLQYSVGGITAGQWITRIGLQFWIPSRDGTLRFAERGESLGPADVEWFANWGRANGVKMLLTVYNYENEKWDWDLARAAFKDNPEVLVKSLVSAVDRYKLDGVDLDLEGNGAFEGDRPAFSKFVDMLSRELKSRKKDLTIDSFHSPCFNAPHMGWWEDWKGKVDAVHSMGYGDLNEGSTESFKPTDGSPACADGAALFRFSWQAKWGKDHGIPASDVLMGLPGGRYQWGKGEARKSLVDHLKDVQAAGAGICIWDVNGITGSPRDSGWGSLESWTALKAFRDGRK